jgi:hypothetical protein
MDRTFAEVRDAFAVWAAAHGLAGETGPPQPAYDATRDDARQAALQALLAADDWRAGRLGDEALRHRLTALILRAAAGAWWQGRAGTADLD